MTDKSNEYCPDSWVVLKITTDIGMKQLGETVTLFSETELFIISLNDLGWGTDMSYSQKNLVQIAFHTEEVL